VRNIILPLILANLLVLAWTKWISPGEVTEPTHLAGRDAGPRETRLVLYAPARVRSNVSAAAPSLMPAAAARRCQRIGPFDDTERAASIANQLGGRGLTVDIETETGEIWVGQWVQIMDLGSAAGAREAVTRLTGVGIKDTYVVRTEPTIDISLGVFRGQDGADQVIGLARQAGLEPTGTDRYRSGTQYWVTVDLLGAHSLDLTDVQGPSSQILRSETVACRPTADIVAGSAGDSLESVAETGQVGGE
jgi:hypothetical protein